MVLKEAKMVIYSDTQMEKSRVSSTDENLVAMKALD